MTAIAIFFEIAFVPWYLTMIIMMWRAIRDEETGQIDQISVWMVALLISGMFHALLLAIDFARLRHPNDYLIAWFLLDVIKAIIVTGFMWHLRFKELIQEWLRKDE